MEFCDSIRYLIERSPVLGTPVLGIRFAEFHSWNVLWPLRIWASFDAFIIQVSTWFCAGSKRSTKPVTHSNSYSHFSLKSITHSNDPHLVTNILGLRDRQASSVQSSVCNPARREGREHLGSKDFWSQAWKFQLLGTLRQRDAGSPRPCLQREFKNDLGKLARPYLKKSRAETLAQR